MFLFSSRELISFLFFFKDDDCIIRFLSFRLFSPISIVRFFLFIIIELILLAYVCIIWLLKMAESLDLFVAFVCVKKVSSFYMMICGSGTESPIDLCGKM